MKKKCITVITEKLVHLAFIPLSVVLREGAQASFSHCHKQFRQCLMDALGDGSEQVLTTINPLSRQNDSKSGKVQQFGTYKLPCHGSGGSMLAQVLTPGQMVCDEYSSTRKGLFFFEYFSFTVSIVPTHHSNTHPLPIPHNVRN